MVRRFDVALLAGFMAVMGCEQNAADPSTKKVTSEDVRRDVEQAAKTTAEYSLQVKEEFQESLEKRLKELDVEIVKLRDKGRELKDQAKTHWDKKMAKLKTKRDAASAKLGEVSQSTAEAWKDVRKGALAAWDELDKSFRDAAKEF